MEVIIILLLALVNGFFAMSEIALVSVKRSRLEARANKGDKGAKIALKLMERPDRFLSSIQVGITLIGVVAGVYGGQAFSGSLSPIVAKVPLFAPYAEVIATVLVVAVITYLNIVLGELTPKTIALNNPERIATLAAPVVRVFSAATYPIVSFLTFSNKILLRLLLIRENPSETVSEEELRMMIKLAGQQGAIENKESEYLHNVFRFGDRRAYAIMTHRSEVTWLDLNASVEENYSAALESGYSKFLVCDDSIDKIAGFVNFRDLVVHKEDPDFTLAGITQQPIYIPDSVTATKVLELFRQQRKYFGVVVNEYGSIEGIVTLHDITENIFGDLPGLDDGQETPDIVTREDGSWLMDGTVLIDEIQEIIPLTAFTAANLEFSTLAGFVFFKMNKIPTAGDHFTEEEFRFEVVDMDNQRIDKVMVSRVG